MLKSRPDSSAMFQSDAALDGLLRALYQRRAHACVMRNSEAPEDQDFIRRMQSNGCAFHEYRGFRALQDLDYVGVNFLCEEKKREMRGLISAGFDVTLRVARRAQLMDMNRFSRPYHHQQLRLPPFRQKYGIDPRSIFSCPLGLIWIQLISLCWTPRTNLLYCGT